jgi:hypothetical protein
MAGGTSAATEGAAAATLLEASALRTIFRFTVLKATTAFNYISTHFLLVWFICHNTYF